jgi:hypothetical protein
MDARERANVPAIHDFLLSDPTLQDKKDVDAAQASLRSLRKLACKRGHDETESQVTWT